jgi:hypothetical protein
MGVGLGDPRTSPPPGRQASVAKTTSWERYDDRSRWLLAWVRAMERDSLLDEARAAAEPELLDASWVHNALDIVDTLIQREWHAAADFPLDDALSRVVER